MTIYSVFDPEFKPYGKVVPGCDTAELCRTLEAVTPLPANRRRLGVLVDRCVGNHRESLRHLLRKCHGRKSSKCNTF